MSARLPLAEHLSSQLFARLFEDVVTPNDRPFVVVNLGPASSDTVCFFGHFRCHLFFVDPDPALLNPMATGDGEPADDDEIDRQLAEQFGLPPELAVDLFLFWDTLNQFDESALMALSRLLNRHCHDRSKGHGYIIHNRRQTLSERCFGVVSDNLFRLLPGGERALAHPCTRARLDNRMTAMAVERSVLHPDGHLEVLLRSGATPPIQTHPR